MPEISNANIVGFGGNDRLTDAVEQERFNTRDIYIIIIDKVIDNIRAVDYCIRVESVTDKYSNVYLVDLLCFEYMILKFKHLDAWIEPVKMTQAYRDSIKARELFIQCIENDRSWIDNNELVAYVVKYKRINTNNPRWRHELAYISSENLAALILNLLTNGGKTDFGISKTHLGVCWTCNCCPQYINNKVGNQKCKIYRYKKTALDKARNLWNGTQVKQIIHDAFNKKKRKR